MYSTSHWHNKTVIWHALLQSSDHFKAMAFSFLMFPLHTKHPCALVFSPSSQASAPTVLVYIPLPPKISSFCWGPLFQSSLCFLDFTCFFPLTTFSFTWTAVKTKQGRGEHFLLSQLHSALLINSSSQNYTLSYSYFSVHWTPWHLCFNKAGAQRFSTSLVSNSVQKQIIKIIFC